MKIELKYQILIIFNTLLFLCYKFILHKTSIKGNYDKWKEFYEKYNAPPFGYIDNLLPFTSDDLFFKISNFATKLSYFIFNTGYNIDEYEEDDFHPDLINNKDNIENNSNISKYEMNDFDTMYDNYFNYSIKEINILEDAVYNENVVNIKPILENGFDKNKIIILFIFFIQQFRIFQNLERNFDLNKIYYLQKNKTSIEQLELYYENLFNYEDNLELISLSQQFIEYHKDFGFFNLSSLKIEKSPKITKTEKTMFDIFMRLRHLNKNEYRNLKDTELGYFLCLFERTVKSINYLGMANSLYKKVVPHFNKDIITLRLVFICIGIFFNGILMTNCFDDEENNKRKKKYK